jgi:hypothetical protein
MEYENVKIHPVKRFFKAVGKALPDILMFIGVYIVVISLVVGLIVGIESDSKAEVLAAENEYLKGQIVWYQARLADEPYVTAPAINEGDPDE